MKDTFVYLYLAHTHTKPADNTWQSLKFLLSSALLEFVGSHKVGELCNPQRYVFYGQQIKSIKYSNEANAMSTAALQFCLPLLNQIALALALALARVTSQSPRGPSKSI